VIPAAYPAEAAERQVFAKDPGHLAICECLLWVESGHSRSGDLRLLLGKLIADLTLLPPCSTSAFSLFFMAGDLRLK
jgi:hypothetical protein